MDVKSTFVNGYLKEEIYVFDTKMVNLHMSEDRYVANHINEFNMIVSQLSSVEINFEEEIKTFILMSSLP